MVWLEGRQMNRCRACGSVFAYRWAGERYCSSADCQAAKTRRRRADKPKFERRKPPIARPWAGVRTAELDAKAALLELRAWIAQERATW